MAHQERPDEGRPGQRPTDLLAGVLRRGVELGSSLARQGRADLEDMAHGLLGESEGRERVEDLLEEVAARSRRGAEQLAEAVRSELRRELAARAARRRKELLRSLARRGREDLADVVEGVGSVVTEVLGEIRSAFGPPGAGTAPPPAGVPAAAGTGSSGGAEQAPRVTRRPSTAAKKAPAKAAAARSARAQEATGAKKAGAKAAAGRSSPAEKAASPVKRAGVAKRAAPRRPREGAGS